jgi:DNA-binding NarL/FixJ family response regulator
MAAQYSSSPQRETDVIRVLVADSTLIGNQLLAAALKRDQHFCVVGTAETSEQVLGALRSPLDIVVVSDSIGSRHSSAFHLTRRVRAAHPDVRVIMLLDRLATDSVVESFRAGASGVFCRAEPLEDLWNCIQSVYEGRIWANNDVLRFVVEALASSTLPRLTATGNACQFTRGCPRKCRAASGRAGLVSNRRSYALIGPMVEMERRARALSPTKLGRQVSRHASDSIAHRIACSFVLRTMVVFESVGLSKEPRIP